MLRFLRSVSWLALGAVVCGLGCVALVLLWSAALSLVVAVAALGIILALLAMKE